MLEYRDYSQPGEIASGSPDSPDDPMVCLEAGCWWDKGGEITLNYAILTSHSIDEQAKFIQRTVNITKMRRDEMDFFFDPTDPTQFSINQSTMCKAVVQNLNRILWKENTVDKTEF